jgi:hypothetical protein
MNLSVFHMHAHESFFLYSYVILCICYTFVRFLVDDPYAVADKWLLKENLPLTYRQQVVEFILQNSGQNNFVPDPSFRDPFTGGKHVFLATVIFTVDCCCLLLIIELIMYLCTS